MPKRFLFIFAILAGVILAAAAQAGFSGSEVHITNDGKALFTRVKVMQIAGSTLFTRLYWGDAFVRMIIKTNSKTKILRATNELTTIKEFSVGDFLDIDGELESGGDSLTLIASKIKNSSLERAQTSVSGAVKSVLPAENKITVDTPSYGLITINIGTSTALIKGSRNIGITNVKAGDKISSALGDYDFKTKILTAKAVTVYVNIKIFEPKVHIGTLSALNETKLPAAITVLIGGIEYSVKIPATAEVLNTARQKTNLSRFEAGDTVRIYGKIVESDEPVIDAEVVRNISL